MYIALFNFFKNALANLRRLLDMLADMLSGHLLTTYAMDFLYKEYTIITNINFFLFLG